MEDKQLIDAISEIGRLLLKFGAEIYRVEESLIRMCQSYGYSDVEVFALPSYFTLTVVLTNDQAYTTSKRSRHNRINLDKIYELNNLVRYTCNNTPTLAYLKQEMNRIKNIKTNYLLVFLGYGIGSGFFATFFGGGIPETIVAFIIGFILYYFILLMEYLDINNLVSTLLSSMLLTSLAIIACNFQLASNSQSITIGCLMILTPGVAITNSLRDIMGGDYISGTARMLEALLTAVFIAIGAGSAMMVLGG
ncbi:threonine/serine exporter ThrE family protein [Thomasclavelia sp.]|uniref:threonine/serine ThrE exporter family protein n=1 Tax=Thomasclavelia sp. TaxID=3025757 RepID=UPI0025E44F2E|nr:threonine/serine exporter family protein [Thomasclavelia sp.]